MERWTTLTTPSPETSSSGRFSGSIRPAHRPLANTHERGRMISASTMPPSLRSTVMDNLAHVAWSGSGCESTSQRLGRRFFDLILNQMA
ncbi:MAG: hypothetical protein ACKOAU_07305 [Pirellula sp.]